MVVVIRLSTEVVVVVRSRARSSRKVVVEVLCATTLRCHVACAPIV